MPSSSIALLGSKEGPWITVKGKNPILRIQGLTAGAIVYVYSKHADGIDIDLFKTNGEHEIYIGEFYRVTCDKPNMKTLCIIENRRVA